MTECSCWVEYPNENHKKESGKWKCVDNFECVHNYDGKIKTHCVKKPKESDNQ